MLQQSGASQLYKPAESHNGQKAWGGGTD